MNSGTGENLLRVTLDTNILISAIGFGGKPRAILLLTLQKKVHGVISPILLAELNEVINKKFPNLELQLIKIEKQVRKKFMVVEPKKELNIVKDEDDNRVLEAAVEGKCDYIITGDKELLRLGKFKNIQILTADVFLDKLIQS